jgi:DNA-binding GntR family transcriptional regulator
LEAQLPAITKGRKSQLGRVFDFHEQIVKSRENQRIVQALHSDLYPLLRIYRRRSGAVTERKEAAYSEHWQILRALKSRDGELAESLMRSHVARAGAHVVQNLSQLDSVAKNAAPTRKRP